jgi:hypothetical protein
MSIRLATSHYSRSKNSVVFRIGMKSSVLALGTSIHDTVRRHYYLGSFSFFFAASWIDRRQADQATLGG